MSFGRVKPESGTGPMPSKLADKLAKARVLKYRELCQTIKSVKSEWRPSADLFRVDSLIAWMLEHTSLEQVEIHSEIHGKLVRYCWGKVSPIEIAKSLTSKGYFCHATAASFHGLLTYSPETIYINREQSPKPDSTEPLNQDAIDRAFSGKQRTSRDHYYWGNARALILNGKNSRLLGVEQHFVSERLFVDATGIERTLIDLTVRPDYAGGPTQVQEAFKRARDRVSVDRIIDILARLSYRYPYHQAIGLLMQRAGYPQDELTKLRALGINYDFYVGYAITEREFESTWRVRFPKNL